MTAARTPRYVPYEEFLVAEAASDLKHEWVDGVVYAMSRGTPEHGRLTMNVGFEMFGHLRQRGCAVFSSDVAILIEAANHHTYADLSVVCGPVEMREVRDKNQKSIGKAITNPCVIVEVLSESTQRYDRDAKFEAYKKLLSFEEYILVWQDEKRIEVRTRDGDRWTTVIGEPGETVRVRGVEVAVDAVYA
ncbi:MAG: Uma2 family endonuclease [Labilithrix sp.]|nr:Uma2 family endonuclease [Labilithrix sp.]MCW5811997.1 Uma2 family endonuclease [Labilithrix sp.]